MNLVGYCVDKGQHMLIYEFMSNGSLENLLYSKYDNTYMIYLGLLFLCDNCGKCKILVKLTRWCFSVSEYKDSSLQLPFEFFSHSKSRVTCTLIFMIWKSHFLSWYHFNPKNHCGLVALR